jgi:hypothetical protein
MPTNTHSSGYTFTPSWCQPETIQSGADLGCVTCGPIRGFLVLPGDCQMSASAATVPSRGFDLACSPGFRRAILVAGQANAVDPSTTVARSTAAAIVPRGGRCGFCGCSGLRVQTAPGQQGSPRRLVSPPFPFELVCGSCLGGALGSASPGAGGVSLT